ncbi:DUF3606 domain-containing protein [Muricoccus nepalensis]
MSNRKWLMRSKINLDDEANARYWATIFKVSDLDLATAVMIVGSDAKDVAAFLGIAPIASSPAR